MSILKIENVHLGLDKKPILKGISLSVKNGEIHAIMGPNGSGKSTLSYMLAWREGYEYDKGKVTFNNVDISSMSAEERANAGLFLAFQYPVELPGVSSMNFLREAVNSRRKYLGMNEFSHIDFVKEARKIAYS